MNLRTDWIDSTTTNDLFFSKEETINDVIENFNYRRNYSAEGYAVEIDNIKEQVIIQDHTNPINESRTDKKMLTSMDSITKIGSYVSFRGQKWLVCSYVNIVDDAYKTCQIQRCNYSLKFQNKSGEILTYPAIFKKTSNIGVGENKVINTDEKKYTVLLPLDNITKLLKVDKRFLCDVDEFEPTAYILTRRDALSHNVDGIGILEIDIAATAIKESTIDRTDLMIADYFSPTVPIPTPPVGQTYYSTLVCSNPKNEIEIDSYRYITATFYDNESTVNSTAIPVFTFTYPVGYGDQFKDTKINDHKIKLEIKDNEELLKEKVIVHVSDVNCDYASSLELTIKAGI
jgi:hypothetical protein